MTRISKQPYFDLDDVSGITGDQPAVVASQRAFLAVLGCAVVAAALFTARILQFSALEYEKYRDLAKRYATVSLTVPARRGIIGDRNGAIIAGNAASYDLKIDLRLLGTQPSVREETERLLDRNGLLSEFRERSAETDEPLIVIPNIPQSAALRLKLVEPQYPALFVQESWTREYADGEAFGNLVGHLGLPEQNELSDSIAPDQTIGKLGIESSQEELLRGAHGKIVFERSVTGQVLKKISEYEPREGKSVFLTVDRGIQIRLYGEMKRYMTERGFQKGALVLMRTNGEIVSLISYPSFDGSVFADRDRAGAKSVVSNRNQPMFSRAISGLYSPGSTIKPLIAAAALEERVIDPDRKILSTGSIEIPNPYVPGQVTVFRDWKAHGWVNMREAIANSSNVYFYAVGGGFSGFTGDVYQKIEGLGITRILKYFRAFGLGEKSGIDLPGEKAAPLPNPEAGAVWRLGDTYNISIGQGALLVTPLRIALWTAEIATNRTVRPFVIDRVADPDGTILATSPSLSEPSTPVLSEETLSIVRDAMRAVVTDGGAKMLSDLPVEVAGKTGTPQFNVGEHVHAIFTGYFPYEKPEYVMTILIEDVRLGSPVVLPLYREAVKIILDETRNSGN